jgi:VIT1/CCC1 family predicted Fe2+/Mn2+ transporter
MRAASAEFQGCQVSTSISDSSRTSRPTDNDTGPATRTLPALRRSSKRLAYGGDTKLTVALPVLVTLFCSSSLATAVTVFVCVVPAAPVNVLVNEQL